MQKSVNNKTDLYTVIYPDGTEVKDSNGRVVILCPTEDEAVEYIRELEANENCMQIL